MSKQETVEVTVKLPKAIVDFLRETEGNVERYIAHSIIELLSSSLDCPEDYVVWLIEKYNLNPAFKEYGVSPPSCVAKYLDP